MGGEGEGESEMVCDTELCLSPGGWARSSGSSASSASVSASRRGKAAAEKQEQNGKITMFYNGRIYVGDVTEIQAIGILISMAKSNDLERRPQGAAWGSNTTASMLPQLPPSDRSLSLKRSLQRFLAKRKARSI